MKSKRRAIMALSLVALIGLVWVGLRLVPVQPLPRYSVRMAGPDLPDSMATAINAAGCVAGNASTTGGDFDMAFTDDGVARTLDIAKIGALAPHWGPNVVGIDNRGNVLLQSYGRTTQAWLWTRDGAHGLHLDAKGHSLIRMNGRGEIALTRVLHDGQQGVFLWSNGTYRQIGDRMRAGAACGAWAVSDTGIVVGVGRKSPDSGAFIWSGASHQRINTPPGLLSFATAVNDRGQVACATHSRSEDNLYLWKDGILHPLPSGGTERPSIAALNNNGEAVGDAEQSGWHFNWSAWRRPRNLISHEQGSVRAMLWRDGRVYRLSELIPPSSGWTLEMATGINDKGQICGAGWYKNQRRAFVLTPIPRAND